MKILAVADVSANRIGSGAGRVLYAHLCGLAGRGHEVTLLHRQGEAKAVEEKQLPGVRVFSYPVSRAGALGFAVSSITGARSLYRSLTSREWFDALVFHQPFSALGVLLAGRRSEARKVYTFLSPAAAEYRTRAGEDGFHLRGGPGKALALLLYHIERGCLRRADQIFVLSNFSRQQVISLFRIPQARITNIPGGVDLRQFHPVKERQCLRQALGLPQGRPLLLSVRNLTYRMGLENLLLALRQVVHAFPQSFLVIGGEGPLREKLMKMVTELGLQQHVRFLGYIPDACLPSYYQAADFFVLPTRALEGFGLVTVESLACGTPVLGTPVGATPEILGDLEKTLLFAGAEPQDLTRGILDHLCLWKNNPQDYESLRQRCRTYVEARFGWERVVAQLERELARKRD